MSMADRDGFIWYDGKLVPWRDATTHVLTHPCTTACRARGVRRLRRRARHGHLPPAGPHPAPVQLGAHLPDPHAFDPDTVNEAQRRRENQLKSCYLRPWSSTAPRRWACRPRAPACTWPSPPGPWALPGQEALSQGIRAKVSSFARQHVNVTMPRAKVATTYANPILANTEAPGLRRSPVAGHRRLRGRGLGRNLFLVKDGVLCEPEIASA